MNGMRLAIVALVAIAVMLVLLITRPHVERYYALVGCTSTEKCSTEKGWWLRDEPLDELPDFHACNQESISLYGDHPRKGDSFLCVERYKLEWGYRD